MRLACVALFVVGCTQVHAGADAGTDALPAPIDATRADAGPIDAPPFDAPCLEGALDLSGTVDGLDLATVAAGEMVGGGCSRAVSSVDVRLRELGGTAQLGYLSIDFGQMVTAGAPLGPRDLDATLGVFVDGGEPLRHDAVFHLELAEDIGGAQVHFAGTLELEGGAGGHVEGWVCSIYICF